MIDLGVSHYRWRSFPLYDKMSIIFEGIFPSCGICWYILLKNFLPFVTASVAGNLGATNLHVPSRVNKTLEEVNTDPETLQAPEPGQVSVDAHDSDSSFHVNNTLPRKRKSTTSGRKKSAHVEAEDCIDNALYEISPADRRMTMQKNVNVPHYTRKSVFVATSGYNKTPQVGADDSIENALDESPSATTSKGMRKNVNEPQCKKKNSNSVATSGYDRTPQVEAEDSIENALEESPSAARSKGKQENLNDAKAIYQMCLEELQRIDELDDSEFSKAVRALKDDKNAIAFMTIRGPRRLIWLRSILNEC